MAEHFAKKVAHAGSKDPFGNMLSQQNQFDKTGKN